MFSTQGWNRDGRQSQSIHDVRFSFFHVSASWPSS
jgi:hypothetical protein